MNKEIKEIIQKFEDDLLSESQDNEDGLLIVEIDVFRKHAEKALQAQKQELREKIERISGRI